MCFNKTEESKLLIAKRDITVYKVGCFADEVRFYSYFKTTYMYSRNTPMREYVDFNRDSINIGLHSLLSLQGSRTCSFFLMGICILLLLQMFYIIMFM